MMLAETAHSAISRATGILQGGFPRASPGGRGPDVVLQNDAIEFVTGAGVIHVMPWSTARGYVAYLSASVHECEEIAVDDERLAQLVDEHAPTAVAVVNTPGWIALARDDDS